MRHTKQIRPSAILSTIALGVALFSASGFELRAQTGFDTFDGFSGHRRISKTDKAKLLQCLYKELEGAANIVAAERIAVAIEGLWRQSGSETVDLLMERSMLALQSNDYNLALKYLSSVVRIAPDYVEGWNQLANVYILKEEYPAAMHQLRQVLALDPHHFMAITTLGRILRELGNKRSALSAFRMALKAHPFMDTAKQAEDELGREVEGQQI